MQKDKYIGRVLKLPNNFLVVPFERIPKLENNDWSLYGYVCIIIRGGNHAQLKQGDRQLLLVEELGQVEVKM